jgi:hypothetical protein
VGAVECAQRPTLGAFARLLGIDESWKVKDVNPQRFTYRPAIQTETCRPLCVLMSSTGATRVQRTNGSLCWLGHLSWIAQTILLACLGRLFAFLDALAAARLGHPCAFLGLVEPVDGVI